MKALSPAIEQYCVFQSDGAVWGVCASSVREIVNAVPFVGVPRSPSQLVGICHLRTEFLPVLELRSLIGELIQDPTPAEQLLVFDGSEGPWGLPVQRARSLQVLDVSLHHSRSEYDNPSAAVLGTATFRDEVIRVIDATRLYRVAVETLDSHWGGNIRPATA